MIEVYHTQRTALSNTEMRWLIKRFFKTGRALQLFSCMLLRDSDTLLIRRYKSQFR